MEHLSIRGFFSSVTEQSVRKCNTIYEHTDFLILILHEIYGIKWKHKDTYIRKKE